jgi:uncharacterized coiled-coil protein SlyX
MKKSTISEQEKSISICNHMITKTTCKMEKMFVELEKDLGSLVEDEE